LPRAVFQPSKRRKSGAPTMVINKVLPCKWMVHADGGGARIWARLGVHAAQYVRRDAALEIEDVVRMKLGKISATVGTQYGPNDDAHRTKPVRAVNNIECFGESESKLRNKQGRSNWSCGRRDGCCRAYNIMLALLLETSEACNMLERPRSTIVAYRE
jgi:hypothetical protein